MRDRRSILRGLAAAPFATVPVLAADQPAATDPTFALIAAHRAAWRHFSAVVGEWSGKLGDPPDEYEVRRDAASDAESEALEALLTPEPTTLAGLRALAEHMFAYDQRMNGELCADEPARWALATLAEACRQLLPGGAA